MFVPIFRLDGAVKGVRIPLDSDIGKSDTGDGGPSMSGSEVTPILTSAYLFQSPCVCSLVCFHCTGPIYPAQITFGRPRINSVDGSQTQTGVPSNRIINSSCIVPGEPAPITVTFKSS